MIADEKRKREVFARLLGAKGPQTRIAVVGASTNPEKYGNIIVNNLKSKGYTVFPVNPKAQEIAGLRVYPSLAEVPRPVDLVNVVTPPPVSLKVLEEADRLGFPLIWFQEGSFDDKVLELLEKTRIEGIVEACIMVVTSWEGLPD